MDPDSCFPIQTHSWAGRPKSPLFAPRRPLAPRSLALPPPPLNVGGLQLEAVGRHRSFRRGLAQNLRSCRVEGSLNGCRFRSNVRSWPTNCLNERREVGQLTLLRVPADHVESAQGNAVSRAVRLAECPPTTERDAFLPVSMIELG